MLGDREIALEGDGVLARQKRCVVLRTAKTARRGAPCASHGERKRNVGVVPAILSLKGRLLGPATAGGLPVPGCGACETSAATYGVANDGLRETAKNW